MILYYYCFRNIVISSLHSVNNETARSTTTINERYKMRQGGEKVDNQLNVMKLPAPRQALLFGSHLYRASHNEHRQTLHLVILLALA